MTTDSPGSLLLRKQHHIFDIYSFFYVLAFSNILLQNEIIHILMKEGATSEMWSPQ